MASANLSDFAMPDAFASRLLQSLQLNDDAVRLQSLIQLQQEVAAPEKCGALQRLVDDLQELQHLRARFNERVETEKLAAMRELAYGASHEINNPLTNIATRAQTLLRDESDPEKRRKLATINSQAFRAFEMIADLMLFAKPPAPQKTAVELGGLVDRLISEMTDDAAAQSSTLRRVGQTTSVVANVDRTQIELAVRALIRNSLEALGTGGEVRVAVEIADGPIAGVDETETRLGEAQIIVADSGPGVPAECRQRIFDPYFSGREAGRGLGLGLSKCWRIAELHGGSIVVDKPDGGAQFRLRLPLATAAS